LVQVIDFVLCLRLPAKSSDDDVVSAQRAGPPLDSRRDCGATSAAFAYNRD